MNTVEVLQPRRVRLDGKQPGSEPNAGGVITETARLLPQRDRTLIGGWCLIDHFGPDAAPLRIAGHPHTGLQAMTWLFDGEIRHRDSLGTDEIIRPGEVGVLTAGWGVTHSEYSAKDTAPLHGVELWAALPDASRFVDPGFEQFATEPVRMGDHEVAVFIGEFGDGDSPVTTYSPLCAAEIRFTTDDPLVVDVPAGWEFGVLADSGVVQVDEIKVPAGSLGYRASGSDRLRLQAHANAGEIVRAIVLGGEPLDEDILLAWNFVGRSHDEIAAWRANWQAGIGAEQGGDNPKNFPLVARTDDDPEYPAPPLPPVRLRPRH
ncbi:pirin family protein [Propionimicrobium sp. PCR01-08-3]|uniref:pirin family protein n=1 Tax=Propionimicrobium sp. PCR01-08-3 TaxID=3052086 RepID=UPI00255CA3A4|nr:pirin family protein [Propionimicrobium sp. PCR01-08-3]WIY82780.1 pirin family protein [Propionimicrobium sp. PCR01-08-3]